ncbi:protein delta homolog 1 [Eublepharis macularius]|uniref:Protein delta homolog 1 n=1 Tax=Eublepharis macularius TaxID=481883 RepID=A0AA97KPQ4_EUBMA|nr:protein delta homolog 1 [Eublepharis macularius]
MAFQAAVLGCCCLWPLLAFPLAQGIDCKPGCHPQYGFCEVSGECRCQPGWQGPLCDRCTPFPGCHHGTCAKPWQCICDEGWLGSICDTAIHPCSSKPCMNNSTCIETGEGSGYICLCGQGYVGKNCNAKKGPCIVNSSLCKNGGTCMDDNGFAPSASCLCLPGFTGMFCEIEADACEPNPCQNGGRCTNITGGFSCQCPSGYGGVFCSRQFCVSNPCTNGGTCHEHPEGGFECICKPQFAGITCASHNRNTSVQAKHRQNHHLHAKGSHRPLHSQEQDVLTIRETVENRHSLLNKSQVICFIVLGLLTCLIVLGTAGIVFFSKFEMWLANARYTHLVRKERDCYLKANERENRSVNIIFPEKIKLTDYS